MEETSKRRSAFSVALVDACILKDTLEYKAHFLLQNFIDGFLRNLRILRQEFLHPVRVFFDRLIAADILILKNILGQEAQLGLQSGGKDRQAHNLD